ncbi:ubiquitin-protein ligase E3 C, partial [Schistosoma bovis]
SPQQLYLINLFLFGKLFFHPYTLSQLSTHALVQKTREERKSREKRYFIELLNELSKQLDDIINKTGFNVEHEFEHKLLKYLTKLPSLTTSSNYTLPIRVLEELFNILIGTCSSTKISLYSKQLYFSIEWICRHLSKHHYFNHLAYFMDQQLPTTTGGYLKDFTTQSQVFDPVEFFKLPKTRPFINLIIAPLKCAFNLSDNGNPFSNPMVDLYRELVFTALNDILISTIDDHNTYIIGERVILSVGMEMFKLPNLHQIVIHGCLTAVENENNQLNTEQQRQQQPHNGTISLIPSINLLHLFVTVAIPGMLVKCDSTTTTSSSTVHTTESSMIQDTDDDDNHEEAVTEEEGGDESLPVLLATESYTHYTWSGSPLEAAITIRFVARILMSCLTEPHLPIVRPVTDPKPLQLRIGQGEELSDDDDGDDGDNKINDKHNRMKGVEISDQEMKMSAEFTRSTNNCSLISEAVLFQPVWATQLTKISVSLSHSLPALAASSLSTLENFNSDLDNSDKLELIRSSSYLHYCLSQVCGLSRTSLIRINSIYSQYTIYLRCLWKLIENTKCLNKSTLNYSNTNMSTLFNILCSGELPTHLVELQSYLPLIFTFADCLHHRLLCLTDSEICDISSEANYTNSNDYRHQQPINNNSEPSRGGCGFRADELLQVGARLRDLMLGLIDLSHPDQVPKQTRCNLQTDTHCVESMEQRNYGAVLRRIEQWVEIADLGSSPIGDLMMRNYTHWSIPDFRLLLYCWCSLLRRVERLVFQIYDWDRRCRRQQDTSLPIYLLQNPQSTTTSASTNASSTFSSSSSSTDISRVTNSPRLPLGTPSLSQTFWLKDNLFDLLNTTESQSSWFENHGYQNTLALAGAPFGYYKSFSLSNRQIRQVLLLKKVPFVIPFEKRVKAIYEGVLVELQFAYFFLAKIVSRSGGGGVGFDYLHSLDPQLYKQLLFLKNYKGDVRDLSLDFTMVQSIFGQSETIELKPGGKHIPVTEENRVEYIYPQVRAFTAGLNDVIPIDWVRLFDAEELQTLISGADMVIDVNDLKQHTFYIGNSLNYTETLDCFWSVLHNFSESDKRSFLRFVTACSRPPMFGFRELQPPFSIQITDEIERLPTASTCTNLLKLPNFRNIKLLRERLLYALNANAGFEYG